MANGAAEIPHEVSRRAWFPLGFVIGSLVLLLVIPLLSSWLANRVRAREIDVANEARALLSEFEGAFAEEVVLVTTMPVGAPVDNAHRARAIAAERATERALQSVVTQLGGAASLHLRTLQAAERRWRSIDQPAEIRGMSPAELRAARVQSGRQVVDAAESLHADLVGMSERGRAKVRRLGRVSVFISAALATLALIAVAMVIALERRVRAFAEQADDRARRLERSIELRLSLMHGVVHDVKNPLGAASGYAELLEEGVAGALSDRQQDMVHRVRRLIGEAVSTVTELVDLARVEAGEYVIELRPTNLVQMVRRITTDHEARATTKSIALSFESSTDALWVRTDPTRLRHVVENLLANALKYTPQDGAVRVVVERDTGDDGRPRARIHVRDTGPGIPPHLWERIFDPFFRVSATEDRAPGSGLGLAVSRRIAGLLGGSIAVGTAPEGGSDFVVTLPIDGPPDHRAGATGAAGSPERPEQRSGAPAVAGGTSPGA